MSDNLKNLVATETQESSRNKISDVNESKSEDIYSNEEETTDNKLPLQENIIKNDIDEKKKEINIKKDSNNNNNNNNNNNLDDSWTDLTKDNNGGCMKKILKEGNGDTPPYGANVYCHYVGTLDSNGNKFDSSRDRDQPFNFPIGKGKVIKGWDIGIKTMKKGEVCILKCRSDYAYGDRDQGSIPAGSTLNFEVELLDFDEYQELSDDKNIKKRVLKEGYGNNYDHPEEFGVANINYCGRLNNRNGNIFSKGTNVDLCINDNSNYINGFHTCIKDMILGEESEFILQPNVCYGDLGNTNLGIEGNQILYFKIELNRFENPKSEYEMTTSQHFSETTKYKESGNKAFKENRYSSALKRYKKAIEIMDHDMEFKEEEKSNAKDIKLILNNNIALVYYKQKEYSESIKHCNKVLEHNNNNIKALIRRGQCNMCSGNFKEAKNDFKQALKVDNNNKTVQKLLKINKNRQKEYLKKQRDLYSSAFKSKPNKKNNKNNKNKTNLQSKEEQQNNQNNQNSENSENKNNQNTNENI